MIQFECKPFADQVSDPSYNVNSFRFLFMAVVGDSHSSLWWLISLVHVPPARVGIVNCRMQPKRAMGGAFQKGPSMWGLSQSASSDRWYCLGRTVFGGAN